MKKENVQFIVSFLLSGLIFFAFKFSIKALNKEVNQKFNNQNLNTTYNMTEETEERPKEKRAYRLKDSIYFFNPFTSMVSVYELRKDGFAYVATKYNEEGFRKYELLLITQCKPLNNKVRAREIDLSEFTDFVKKLEVLQEQAHAFKPLVAFDDYVKIISQSHGLDFKEK